MKPNNSIMIEMMPLIIDTFIFHNKNHGHHLNLVVCFLLIVSLYAFWFLLV